MICQNCGKEIDNDSKFCSFCTYEIGTTIEKNNIKKVDKLRTSSLGFLKDIGNAYLLLLACGYILATIQNSGHFLIGLLSPYILIFVFFISLFTTIPIYFIRFFIHKYTEDKLIGLLFTFLGSLLLWFTIAFFSTKGIIITNNKNYRKYYSESEFKDSRKVVKDVVETIKGKKYFFDSSVNKILSSEIKNENLSKYGKSIIPYAIYLEGERKFHLIFIGHGIGYFYSTYPYRFLSYQIIQNIRDKEAIPILKKMITDPYEKLPALEALCGMEASLNKSEVLLLFNDKYVRDKFWSYLVKNITDLDSIDSAEILLLYLKPKFIDGSVDLEGGGRNLHYIYDKIEKIKEITILLGNTNSKVAYECINRQLIGFKYFVNDQYPVQIKQKWSDTGYERLHEHLKICKELIVEYEKSIKKMSSKTLE
ncbi:MAG: zinc ribbon domain-containing protein [Elusimicrobia bacterium]|nr:zinc ribbon domain-containing protein [Elusimicrobiota bacterium]